MTLIRAKYTRLVYELFGTRTGGMDDHPYTLFLIYDVDGWTWVSARNFEPVYTPDHVDAAAIHSLPSRRFGMQR